MKITETRKTIIELIEPFMDKDLKQFCVIKSHKGLGYFIFLNSFNEIEYVNNLKHFCVEKHKCEILGHYDITAVLKFIKIKGSFTIEFYDDGIGIVGKEDYFIPSKPLHLYSDEEDKHLLKILTNLK